MRIYTRTGDDGTTGLAGSRRVFKDSARVEALGSVDELSAALGLARALEAAGPLSAELGTLQTKLLRVGAELAVAGPDAPEPPDRIGDDDVATLERWIDRIAAELPPAAGFVLPGGSEMGARLHVARTACRRAERRVVALQRMEPGEPRLVRYLNRLGDLLFVMARWCDRRAETAGTQGGRQPR